MAKPTQSTPGSKPASNAPTAARSETASPVGARRSFMTYAMAIVCGGLVGLVPLLSGLVVFLDPLRRKNKRDQFIRVAALDSLPDDGIPRKFAVVAEHVDAWNRSIDPIGAVYLRRAKDAQAAECLTATCPHAGCFVSYDDGSNTFKCPCHNSVFTVDGQIIEPSPSPRAMDTLECKIEGQEILVKFENFYTGKAEKVVKE